MDLDELRREFNPEELKLAMQEPEDEYREKIAELLTPHGRIHEITG